MFRTRVSPSTSPPGQARRASVSKASAKSQSSEQPSCSARPRRRGKQARSGRRESWPPPRRRRREPARGGGGGRVVNDVTRRSLTRSPSFSRQFESASCASRLRLGGRSCGEHPSQAPAHVDAGVRPASGQSRTAFIRGYCDDSGASRRGRRRAVDPEVPSPWPRGRLGQVSGRRGSQGRCARPCVPRWRAHEPGLTRGRERGDRMTKLRSRDGALGARVPGMRDARRRCGRGR